jgi:hypothetical protein
LREIKLTSFFYGVAREKMKGRERREADRGGGRGGDGVRNSF